MIGRLDGVAGRRPVQYSTWSHSHKSGKWCFAARKRLAAHRIETGVEAVQFGRPGNAQTISDCGEHHFSRRP